MSVSDTPHSTSAVTNANEGRQRPYRRARAPACTHINMDRHYGWDQYCDNCGHPPSLGFLYVCSQDAQPSTYTCTHTSNLGHEVPEANSSTSLRAELERYGFSESIIRQAEDGVYTEGQLEYLKQQKVHLREVVQDQENRALTARLAENLANISLNDGSLLSGPEEQVFILNKSRILDILTEAR